MLTNSALSSALGGNSEVSALIASSDRLGHNVSDFSEKFLSLYQGYNQDAEWQKTLTAIDRTRSPQIRMALILCCCRCPDPVQTLREMKFSVREIRETANLLELKDADISSHTAVRKLMRRLQVPFQEYLEFRQALDPSLNIIAAQLEYDDVLRRRECWQLRDLAVSGSDIKALGIQGKEISDTLEYLLNQVMEDRIFNRREDLLKAAEEYKKNRSV